MSDTSGTVLDNSSIETLLRHRRPGIGANVDATPVAYAVVFLAN